MAMPGANNIKHNKWRNYKNSLKNKRMNQQLSFALGEPGVIRLNPFDLKKSLKSVCNEKSKQKIIKKVYSTGP